MGLIIQQLDKRWPGNCLVIKIAADLENETSSNVDPNRGRGEIIADALDTIKISVNGDFDFVIRSNQEHYVEFIHSDDTPAAARSALGMTGGRQTINIEMDANDSSIIHEICHALGIYHEHVRPDRDNFVQVVEKNIQTGDNFFEAQNIAHNFEKVGFDISDRVNVGSNFPYDFASIMHYPKDGFGKLQSDGTQKQTIKAIVSPIAANEALMRSQNLSVLDINSIRKLNDKSCHVIKIMSGGKLDRVIQKFDIDRNFTQTIPIAIHPMNYICFLNRTTGRLEMRNIGADGKLGEQFSEHNFSDGNIIGCFYQVLGTSYLLMLNKAIGKYTIRRIGFDGTVQASFDTGNMEKGWDVIEHFYLSYLGAELHFLLFINKDTGTHRIKSINSNGTINSNTHQNKTFTTGWSIAKHYKILAGNYIFCYKKSTGLMKVREATFDGKIGVDVQQEHIQLGFDLAQPFKMGLNNFMILFNKSTGLLNIHEIKSDGKLNLDNLTDTRKIGNRWNSLCVYSISGSEYLILIREA